MELLPPSALISSEGSVPAIGLESQLIRPSFLRSAEYGSRIPHCRQDNLLVEPLTARELEVLTLVCDGQSNQGVAKRLGIEVPTVKFHVNQIFGKLGVARRTQAVAIAVFLGMVKPGWLPPSVVRPTLNHPSI